MTEDEARAFLCAELPSLRQEAAAGGWTAALADALTVLDEGGTALDVLALLDPAPADDADEEVRGDLQPYLLFGAAGPELHGVYVCPDGWCGRRAGRDARNRPPVCGLRRRPMRFTES
ncbi:hypothetical protein ACIA8R_18535 [Nonomuraea sp. NPDC051191]|uniref:hypothetical protein n=1 Tax=Nonomuraea sp. NPDC051191 TaxID=3364372 RepID=UPI0037948085